METDFMGKAGFIWAIGVVEDRNDPLYLGRCKVRYLGWHTRDKQELPTVVLPWSFPLMPITSASQTQVGTSPTGPVPGTWVLSFFKDGVDATDPIMLGTLPGRPDKACDPKDGFNDPRYWQPKPFQLEEGTGAIIEGSVEFKDVPQFPLKLNRVRDKGVEITERTDDPDKHKDKDIWEFSYNFPNIRFLNEPTTPRLARGLRDTSAKILNRVRPGPGPASIMVEGSAESPLQNRRDVKMGKFGIRASDYADKPTFMEPESAYAAQYPYNHVHQTESGHVIEMDDTPTAERLSWTHRSGAYREMGPAGDVVDKATRDAWSCVLRNSYEQISGNKFSSIDYGYELAVAATGGKEDYWLRVCGTGDVHLEAEEGNIEMYTKNGVTFINAKRIEFNAKEYIKMSAPRIQQTKFPRNNPSLNPSEAGDKSGQEVEVAGNQAENVGGAKTVNAGQIGLNTMGPFTTSCQSEGKNISHSSETNVTGLNILLGQGSAGWSTAVQNGIINLRSADAKAGTGGILLHLNELPVSSPSSAKSSAVGYLSILPQNPISADIELASTFGNITMKNKFGEITLGEAPLGTGGNLKLESNGIGAELLIKTPMAEISFDKMGLISIKNEVTSLTNVIKVLFRNLLEHTHGHVDSIMGTPNMFAVTLPNAAQPWYPDLLKEQAMLESFFAA